MNPSINIPLLETLIALPPLPITERADRLLRYYASKSDELGQWVAARTEEVKVASHCSSDGELEFLLNYSDKQKYLERSTISHVRVLPEGYIRIDEQNLLAASSMQGFVAMWFADEMTEAFTDGLSPGISDAGYIAHRVDQREHVEKIDDEIIKQIRRSRFVVADFTGHRGGVYFEAGFAMGLGLPVIWTCRKEVMKDLHFDIRQYNVIDWTTPGQLRERLSRRVEAVLGRGPIKG